jgi:glycosyltransferase involved in cell wall biosynthesis
MLLSVIINNYNYGPYLSEAIKSALNQTYKPLEVIVVDDGSTDNSREVISSFGDRITTVLQQNAGQNAACNAGWRKAKGDMVVFLDSDDVLLPDAAEKCASLLRGTDLAKVQFLMNRVDAGLKPIGGTVPTYGLKGNSPRHDIALWGHYKTSPTSANVYSRKFLELVMPLPEFSKSDPYYMWQDTYLAQVAGIMDKVASIHEPLALYRVHGKNNSDMGQVQSVQKMRRLFMNDYLREKYQVPWAEKFNFHPKADRIRFCPHVCKQRFLSYRLQPEGHPIPEDNYWYLLTAGLTGALRFPYMTPPKRVFIFCSFIAIGLLPRFALQKIIGMVTKPEERKGVFALLRFGH